MPRNTGKQPDAGDGLPATLKRSDPKAQRTFRETHDSAEEQYGEGERSYRTAWAAVKHTHEKVGEHWEPKAEPGPSDPQAALSGKRARRGERETFGGVDVLGHTRQELYERARSLSVKGASRMSKQELARAIQRKQ